MQESDLAPFLGDFSQIEKLSEIKPPLKESSEKIRKVRQQLATKVFLSDSSNDLEFLLTLDIENLFDKYEKISRPNHLDRMKIEEITETLNDVKTKLKLQVEQRTSYEKLHGEIMDILSIPEGNRFINVFIRCFHQFVSRIFSTNFSQFEQFKKNIGSRMGFFSVEKEIITNIR